MPLASLEQNILHSTHVGNHLIAEIPEVTKTIVRHLLSRFSGLLGSSSLGADPQIIGNVLERRKPAGPMSLHEHEREHDGNYATSVNAATSLRRAKRTCFVTSLRHPVDP